MNAPRLAIAALSVASLFAIPARAQSWRTLTAQRQIAKEDALHVEVRYGLGKLTVRAADPAVLYDVSARYDADIFRFERNYDPAKHQLFVGADSATAERFTLRPHFFSDQNKRSTKGGYLTVALARGIPINLTVNLAMGGSEIDLGGLWLSHLLVLASMGEATITFRTANPQPMHEIVIDASLGGITIKQLGNARAERVRLNVGLGGADVDVRGAWTGEMTLDGTVTMGGLNLSVPRDAGVKVTAYTKLAGLDAKGFVKKDGAYYSANYETAPRKLTVTGGVTLGGIEVNWVEP